MKNKNLMFCKSCCKMVCYTIKDNVPMTGKVKNVKYEYLGKETYCKECGNAIYNPGVFNYNMDALYDKHRHANNLISLQKIREIPQKYDIDNRSLSLLLGWGEYTFSRLYDGNIPIEQYSDTLIKIYNNPKYYLELLETGKHDLASLSGTYQKSYKAASALLKRKNSSKILIASQYLINNCEGITALTLQKALYYAQGWYSVFYGSFIFRENCEVWTTGPVYRKAHEVYKEYEDRIIQPDKSITDFSRLSANEIAVLDYISDYFCTFSDRVLGYFIRQEQPWINGKKDASHLEESNKTIPKAEIQKHFCSIKDKYGINKLSGIRIYTEDMFSLYLKSRKTT